MDMRLRARDVPEAGRAEAVHFETLVSRNRLVATENRRLRGRVSLGEDASGPSPEVSSEGRVTVRPAPRRALNNYS